mgnify:CR=1 FL=1
MCFAIRGLPAVIDTSLPHGYKKSEPYKASYSPDWNGCGQKATAVRPKALHPRFGDGADIRHRKPRQQRVLRSGIAGYHPQTGTDRRRTGVQALEPLPQKGVRLPPAVGLLPPAS